ncbi:hypothetical protein [Moorena producens]|uniref:hypothetical protein n=1 Tax=Moorena producens TaxID=1155739 RepID=UPI003C743ACF
MNDHQFVALWLVVKVREKCAASPTSLDNIAVRASLCEALGQLYSLALLILGMMRV